MSDANRPDLETSIISRRSALTDLWEPPAPSDATPISNPVRRSRQTPPLQAELEDAMIAVLKSPPAEGESHVLAGARREREVMAILDELDGCQAHHLGQRLDLARLDDPIVVAFHRVTSDRRQRLRRYIADTRRRIAHRQAKAG
jgi:hypothetical protein